MNHIISESTKLAQKEYKRRHDNVAKIVHWKLRGKYELMKSAKWYEHEPEKEVANENVRILWDFNIQCHNHIQGRRPDIVVIEKETGRCVRSSIKQYQESAGSMKFRED